MALLWLAQPTISWWPLAWFAPLPWLWVASQPKLPGRRPYPQFWLAGFAYWLTALSWIPMAHPLQYINWLLLSGYLGCYLPITVRAIRIARFRWTIPIWISAPIAWVACDYLMAHVITGIAMATPVHTQLDWLPIVQCVDLFGPYTLAFLMMLVPAAIVTGVHRSEPLWSRIAGLTTASCLLIGAILYGTAKLAEPMTDEVPPPLRVALVQGNEPAVWEADADRDRRVVKQYRELTLKAVNEANTNGQPIDAVIWPENMFRDVLWTYADKVTELGGGQGTPADYAAQSLAPLVAMTRETGANIIVGIDRTHVLSDDASLPVRERFEFQNSAAMVDRDGELLAIYAKTHLVPFGEYLPFADWFPWVYDITPMGLGLTPGVGPVAPEIEGVRIAPSICYESVLPHVIRRHIAELADCGERPELLVNITNDSWFRQSCELDMHLACNRLRAIEMRTPMVVAANGGLSASIDAHGRLLAVSGKQTAETLVVDVHPGCGTSAYLFVGDWPAMACVVLLIVVLISSRWRAADCR